MEKRVCEKTDDQRVEAPDDMLKALVDAEGLVSAQVCSKLPNSGSWSFTLKFLVSAIEVMRHSFTREVP